jgi:hypothetical protein
MSAITTATNTQELQALTAESLQRMEQSGANVSGQLLRLGQGSGSGSGVVPNYGMGSHPSGGYQTMGGSHSMPGGAGPMSQNEPAKGNSTLLIVIAVGFFLLAGLLIVVLGLRDHRKPDPTVVDNSTAPPSSAGITPGTAAPTDSVAVAPPPADTTTTPAPPQTGPTGTVAKPPIRNQPPVVTQKQPLPGHPPPPPPPPAEDKDPGFLTINVYPWAKVSEGGRVLCAATPCNKIPLSPGTHTLQLENPEQGVKQSTTVTIKSGETATRAIGFK